MEKQTLDMPVISQIENSLMQRNVSRFGCWSSQSTVFSIQLNCVLQTDVLGIVGFHFVTDDNL